MTVMMSRAGGATRAVRTPSRRPPTTAPAGIAVTTEGALGTSVPGVVVVDGAMTDGAVMEGVVREATGLGPVGARPAVGHLDPAGTTSALSTLLSACGPRHVSTVLLHPLMGLTLPTPVPHARLHWRATHPRTIRKPRGGNSHAG